MATEDADGAAIDFRSFDVEHVHVVIGEETDQRPQRIISQMLMEDVVVVALLNHGEPVLIFGGEDAALAQQQFRAAHHACQVGNVSETACSGESVGRAMLFENARGCFFVEEGVQGRDALRIGDAYGFAGGVDTQEANSRRDVGFEQGSVVRSDIDSEIVRT